MNLTKTQRLYLDEIVTRGRLVRGWGGFGSTQTVRILQERGLVTLHDDVEGRWRARPTDKGRALIRGIEVGPMPPSPEIMGMLDDRSQG